MFCRLNKRILIYKKRVEIVRALVSNLLMYLNHSGNLNEIKETQNIYKTYTYVIFVSIISNRVLKMSAKPISLQGLLKINLPKRTT